MAGPEIPLVHALPDRPDHPRYLKRLKQVNHLLRQKKDHLVEEGMILDWATALDDLHWFCKRFTSFVDYQITERSHPLKGTLWIDHPFIFWLTRQYQEALESPGEGWWWFEIHRWGLKTTLLLAATLREHAKNQQATIGLWTHQADKIGSGMGRGMLAQIQTEALRDHAPQFRNLQEGSKQGYVLDREPGPRDQSLSIYSILTSTASAHPDMYLFDDAVSDKLRDNPEQIAKIKKNISLVAAAMSPDAPVVVNNTRWDEADPWVEREKEGLFCRHIKQSATRGGSITIIRPNGEREELPGFTESGRANMHTQKFFDMQRKQINDDSIYFPQYELYFHRGAELIFDWSRMTFYDETPEEVATRFPYINIIVDGAGGKKDSDFACIRVFTWVAEDAWANLDLIRERVGWSKAAQILLGRDPKDSSTKWVEDMYCPGGVGIVEKWMKYDPRLVVWFDPKPDWREDFLEHVRLRGVRFGGGQMPTTRTIPEIHRANTMTKLWNIQRLDGPYSQGKAAYPRQGFKHGSAHGLAGEDKRDTMLQFKQDEFDRMRLGHLPTHDDMLDTESATQKETLISQMRRPHGKSGLGMTLGGIVYPAATIDNPWGLPNGGRLPVSDPMGGRTWASM